VPIAYEFGFEHWCAPFVVFIIVRGPRGAHGPTGLGGARIGFGREPDEDRRDVSLSGGEGEPAAGHEIEDFRLGRNLGDDRAKRGTGEPIGGGAQDLAGIRRAHQDHRIRVESQLDQPGGMKLAEFERGEILPDPEQRLSFAEPQAKACGKPRRRPAMAGIPREHFVQRALGEPAAEGLIGAPVAERHARLTIPQPGFGQ